MKPAPRFISRVILVAAAVVSIFLFASLTALPVRAAASFFVGTMADDAGTSTGSCSANGNTTCSLRDAITAANGAAGASTITIPAGTYNLSNGELDLGAQANQSITVQGAGAATTTIHQDGFHSLFVTDPNLNSGQSFTFQGLTITGGLDTGFGGGGIQAGAPGQALSIINCTITGNKSTNQGGGGVTYTGDGTVTITNSTFSNNTAASPASGGSSTGGGLLLANLFSTTTATVTISGSTFDANTAGSASSGAQSQGGAIAVTSSAMNVTISKSTFTNNKALNGTGMTGQGGALFNEGGGSLTVQYSRFGGNTAAQGSTLFQGTATTTAIENWWGTNASPASLISGTSNFTPYLTLTQTAALSTLATGQGTTLTASFLKNSAGTTESASNLDVLIGLPVTWNNAVKGTLSNQQTSIQSTGTATATFTATTVGQGSADVTVDNGTATTNPTITIHAIATQLVFTQAPPASATAGTSFPVQVTAEDGSGNVDTSYAGQITLAPSVTDAGATGLGPATPTNGVATFSVTLTVATASQTLGATGSVNGLTGTSAPFAIVATTAGSITAVAGTPQSATVNTAFGTPLKALVKDGFNNPVPNATVTFTAPALTGASGTFAGGGITKTAQTDSTGTATATVFTADTIAGAYTVTAGVDSVATTADFSLTNSPGAPATIAANTGTTPQTTQVGQAFATALAVTVSDQYGNPVGAGSAVTYTITPAGGASATLSGGTVITNASGQASVTATATSTAGGPYTVAASVAGVGTSATFSLTNTPGAPASIAATAGTPQSTTVATAFGTALGATVKDASGNAVPGVTVTFTAPGGSIPTGTFTGNLASTTVTTNASGVATAPTFTANTKVGGPYTVMATAAGAGTPATFALTNTPGAPASLTPGAATTPQSATVNTTFTIPLAATLADQYGNPISGVSVTFTAPASGASGVFTGSGNTATATTNTQGLATAPSITANGTAGGYNVAASGGGVNNATAFALTNLPGAPSSIAVTAGGGQHTSVATPFATNLQATVKDANGNLVLSATVTFTAPTGPGAGGAFPGGATANATTNEQGVATAPTLTANTVAGTFSVTASAAGAGTPASFALTNTPGSPATVTATAGGGQHAPVMTAFPIALTVAVADQYGNPGGGVTVTFTAPGGGASGVFSGGGASATATTNPQGVATAPTFTANGTAGGYAVSASVGGVATPATFALTNTPALVSVAVTAPGSLGSPQAMKVGQTAQLIATGTFTDSSTQDFTSQATWSSDKPDEVSVDASGKVTAKIGGTATITASYGGKQGTITVTVAGAVFTGVQPAPAPAGRPSGASVPAAPSASPVPMPAPLPVGR